MKSYNYGTVEVGITNPMSSTKSLYIYVISLSITSSIKQLRAFHFQNQGKVMVIKVNTPMQKIALQQNNF